MTNVTEPSMRMRPMGPADHPFVLDLNARFVDVLSPLDEPRLVELAGLAAHCDIVELDGVRAGWVLTFDAAAGYDGSYFAWYAERFGGDFCYLDRIVIDTPYARRGLAAFAYDRVEEYAAPYGRLALEVNVLPPNEPSLAFHRKRGYEVVGEVGDDTKRVAMLVKELPAQSTGGSAQ